VTFAAPDLATPIGANDRMASPYKKGATYSGTYLNVLVNKSRVVPEEDEPEDNAQVWTEGDRKGLFVSQPAAEVCPKVLNSVIAVSTVPFCCDQYPWFGSCLVPSMVQKVTIAAPSTAN
jgi:hypothetical protein